MYLCGKGPPGLSVKGDRGGKGEPGDEGLPGLKGEPGDNIGKRPVQYCHCMYVSVCTWMSGFVCLCVLYVCTDMKSSGCTQSRVLFSGVSSRQFENVTLKIEKLISQVDILENVLNSTRAELATCISSMV